MSKRKTYRERSIPGFFGKAEKERAYTLPEALFTSDAWRVLSPAYRDVLLDMIMAYYRVSTFDRDDISKTGFTYTYSQCGVDVSDGTFQPAVKRFLGLGFFKDPPEIQGKRGKPKRYVPSDKWRRHVASKEQRKQWDAFENWKAQRIRTGTTRKIDYLRDKDKTHT